MFAAGVNRRHTAEHAAQARGAGVERTDELDGPLAGGRIADDGRGHAGRIARGYRSPGIEGAGPRVREDRPHVPRGSGLDQAAAPGRSPTP